MTGDQVVNVNSGELWVSIDPGADYDETLASIDDVVGGTRGVERDVVAYTTQKIRDVGALQQGDNDVGGDDLDVLTGSDEPLVVRVYGQDLATLTREATQGAAGRVAGRWRRRPAPRAPGHAAERRDRDRPRPGATVRSQAGRRTACGGRAAPGHPGGEHLPEAEGLRRDRAGHSRDAQERVECPEPAARPAQAVVMSAWARWRT